MITSLLINIQNQINHYGYIIALILGSIGNLFIFIIFNRQRHNACSFYLVTSATANFVYVTITYLVRSLYFAYINESMVALILCKFRGYLGGTVGQVGRTALILACIDRYLITSDRAHFRALSTLKRAKYFVFLANVLWAVTSSHLLVFFTVVQGECVRIGVYATFYAFYAILLLSCIPSIILIIFSYLTYRNLKDTRMRIQPINQAVNHTNHILQRRDRDLLVLVIAEVIVYVITTALYPIILLEIMISGYTLTMKTIDYYISEIFTLNLAIFLLYVYSAVPFYTYILSSTSFRQDFQHLIIAIYLKYFRRIAVRPPSQTGQSNRQQETGF